MAEFISMPDRWHNVINGVRVEVRYAQDFGKAPTWDLFLDHQLVGSFRTMDAAAAFAKKEIKKRKSK